MKTMTYHIAEIYTKGPEGQTGWDIVHVALFTADRARAIQLVKRVPSFDCIITLGEFAGKTGLAIAYAVDVDGFVRGKCSAAKYLDFRFRIGNCT